MNRFVHTLAVCLMLATPAITASAQTSQTTTTGTIITFLGTGTPNANPDRQGPSFVVQTGGNTYLFDMGVGLMRQAAKANAKLISGQANINLSPPTAAFLSHLHTDHTIGLPDLIFTPWSGNSPPTSALQLFGPVGLQWMVTNIQNAYKQDICVRNVCERLGQNPFLPPVVNEISLPNTPTGGPTSPPTGGNAPTCHNCAQCPAGFNCICGAELPKSQPAQVYSDSKVKVTGGNNRNGQRPRHAGVSFKWYTIQLRQVCQRPGYRYPLGRSQHAPRNARACSHRASSSLTSLLTLPVCE